MTEILSVLHQTSSGLLISEFIYVIWNLIFELTDLERCAYILKREDLTLLGGLNRVAFVASKRRDYLSGFLVTRSQKKKKGNNRYFFSPMIPFMISINLLSIRDIKTLRVISESSWALLRAIQCWTCLCIYTLATYYSAGVTSFWLAISPVQSLCCRGMFKAEMCIGVCLFAADDLPKLWCAVTFWHLCISAVNNVNSFSEHFDYLHIAVPMACDREEHSIH